MSGFQVGDVVVCVRTGMIACPHSSNHWHTGEGSPANGSVSRIEAIYLDVTDDGFVCGCTALRLSDGLAGIVQRFRKIRPASEEFIHALRACKPERIGEPA